MLLLRGALLSGPVASQAAAGWLDDHRTESAEGFRHLHAASRRLLPLLHRNVKEGIPAPFRAELRAVHHHYWAENQQLFRKLEVMLVRFEAAGIPTLVLKGAALSTMHYDDMALRPMSDFDILVPEDRGPALVRQFIREGWVPDWPHVHAPGADYFFRFRHALDLSHPQHGTVDLHWHVLLEATYRGADAHFWEGSIPLRIKSVLTRALNPADQLLHTCLHGYPYNPMPSIRWIADALTILRTATIDWDRLLRVAVDLQVTIPCTEALDFLNREFDAGVPFHVVDSLAACPVSPAGTRFFRRMADPGARRWWETLEDIWTATARATRDLPFTSRIASFPQHLQWQQELPSLASLLPHAFVFLKRRFVSRPIELR